MLLPHATLVCYNAIMIKLKDIVEESCSSGKAWIWHDKKQSCLTVFITGTTHSTSDCSFPADVDGLSLAIVRRNWHNRQPGLPRLPHYSAEKLAAIAAQHGF